MAKSKQRYYINHEHIAALRRGRPLSAGEVEKIKTAAYAKVDIIRDEEIVNLYQELSEGEERDIQEAYINERADSRKKTILKLEANGLPIIIFLLLCSTPEAKGWIDSSCGGSCRDGFKFGECDSTVAVDNIIDTLLAMGIIQLVDPNDKTRCDANNSRKCMISEEELEEMARWSCPAYTDREAKCTARFIEIYIETANKLNVPVILLEAGGVTKGCSKVTDILVANKDIHIDLLLRDFWHIQFFNRKSSTMCEQVKIISEGVGAFCSLLDLKVNALESFEDILWSIHKGRVCNRPSDADIEMAKTMFHERSEASELNKKEILDAIKDEFGLSTMKIVRHQIGVVDATTMYHKLKDENKYELNNILAKLKEEGFDENVLKSVRSNANNSDATTRYHEIVDANPGLGNDEIVAKLKDEGFGKNVLDYVCSRADISDAMTRYHEIAEETLGLGVNDILVKLKEEGFEEGVLRFVDTNANRSAATTMYHKLVDEDKMDRDAALSKMEKVFKPGVLNWVRSTANRKKSERGLIPASPNQMIFVACPDSNCNNTKTTTHVYNHNGKTKIVLPRCGKTRPGKRECRRHMKPVESPTPLETISLEWSQKIEKKKEAAAAANASSENEVEPLETNKVSSSDCLNHVALVSSSDESDRSTTSSACCGPSTASIFASLLSTMNSSTVLAFMVGRLTCDENKMFTIAGVLTAITS